MERTIKRLFSVEYFMQDVIFKKCSKDDILDLIEVSQQCYPEHYSHVWKRNDPSYYINLSFNKKAFEEDFKTSNIIYFLIKKENNVLGLLKIRKHQKIKNFNDSEALQLEKIYLLKTSTGLGIGKKGIDFTKKYAFNLGKKAVWLDVMTTSPALPFYKKSGFNTVSFYNLDYPDIKDEYREMQRMIYLF
ncbi:GNAT family N-acetyltransferase [Aquimarina sediminis]|uniref:GNAT family N-acetyltransferase n=1 Tax=Aquimarina sediminis TaxID=2070536 RepID=UPI000CA03075|nr:GNAT family N-acetyltransferase [Aquimarina sediminis]